MIDEIACVQKKATHIMPVGQCVQLSFQLPVVFEGLHNDVLLIDKQDIARGAVEEVDTEHQWGIGFQCENPFIKNRPNFRDCCADEWRKEIDGIFSCTVNAAPQITVIHLRVDRHAENHLGRLVRRSEHKEEFIFRLGEDPADVMAGELLLIL